MSWAPVGCVAIHDGTGRPPLRPPGHLSPDRRGRGRARGLVSLGSLPLPPEGGEAAPRSGDGVGEAVAETRWPSR
ncbi:hypothetical protein FJ934_04450 [Mesorhizobium sp. B2-4-12]|nr:hypothetical protein FJ548_18325 [Mesorhizobium sp. B2-4-17]TPK98510.1 hypothetical protein FJ934_04450 [Mesorhizobium sp. B2-4-12]